METEQTKSFQRMIDATHDIYEFYDHLLAPNDAQDYDADARPDVVDESDFDYSGIDPWTWCG